MPDPETGGAVYPKQTREGSSATWREHLRPITLPAVRNKRIACRRSQSSPARYSTSPALSAAGEDPHRLLRNGILVLCFVSLTGISVVIDVGVPPRPRSPRDQTVGCQPMLQETVVMVLDNGLIGRD